ncbi:MAG: sulfurtransferase TusA family protein [Candidatus Nanopelagicales bacterium]
MLPKADVRLNQRGYRCPMPVVAVSRAAKESDSGTVIAVTCTDPGAASDIPAWCDLKGVDFLGSQPEADGSVTYLVRTR